MLANWPLELAGAAALLLTYLLHSTALLGLAWFLTACCRISSPHLREMIWKVGLLGPIVTSVFSTVSEREPWIGQIVLVPVGQQRTASSLRTPLPQQPARRQLPDSSRELSQRHRDAHPNPGSMKRRRASQETAHVNRLPSEATEQAPEQVPLRHAELGGSAVDVLRTSLVLSMIGLGGWFLGFVWFGGRLAVDGWSLAQTLARCRETPAGPLRKCLDSVLGRASIRRSVQLFVSPSHLGPIAVGFLRWRIGIPARAVAELAPREQQSLLAHELAHLVRRDCLWLWCSRLVEAVFFFQPLNRLAALRIRTDAEYLCDAWVVRQTGDRFSLACCLTSMAGWRTASSGLPIPTMAGSGSTFAKRIDALMGESPATDTPQGTFARRAFFAIACCFAVLLAWAGPRAVVQGAAAPEISRLRSDPAAVLSMDGKTTLRPRTQSATAADAPTSFARDLALAAEELKDLELAIRDLVLHLQGNGEDQVQLSARLARLQQQRQRLEQLLTALLSTSSDLKPPMPVVALEEVEIGEDSTPSTQGDLR